MSNRVLKIWLWLIVAAVACGPRLSRGGLERSITRRGALGFHVLVQVGYQYKDAQCGHRHAQPGRAEAHIIQDEGAYAALYARWELCWQPPPVDFGRYIVVGIVAPEAGCEYELAGFDLSAQGHLSPRLVALGTMCHMIEVRHHFLAAIPRAALPARGVYLAQGAARDWARFHGAPVPRAALPIGTSVTPFDRPIARVALPARGQVRIERVGADSLLWTVHANDGTVSAVSAWARTPERPTRIDQGPNVAGLFVSVLWSPEFGRFLGGWSHYDPHGVNVMGRHLPNLDAYRVIRQDQTLVLYGPPTPAAAVDLSEPSWSDGPRFSRSSLVGMFHEPALSLAQAKETAEGSVMKIEADVVRFGDDRRVWLCELAEAGPDRFERCRREGAWIEDARVVPRVDNPYAHGAAEGQYLGADARIYFIASGTVLARRTRAGFAEVRLLDTSFDYQMVSR